MPTYYVDFENGNDANDGLSFANRRKTLNFASTTNSTQYSGSSTIRVMATESPVLLGNATWAQQEVGAQENIQFVYDSGGEIEIKLSVFGLHTYPNNGFVVIYGSSYSSLNGLWKTTYTGSQNDCRYVLQGSNFTDLGVSSGSSHNANLLSINGKIIRVPGQLVKPITPNWSSMTVSNPATAWANILGCSDGVSEAGVKYDDGTFKSIPQTSWRLHWNSDDSAIITESVPYFDARTISSGSWSDSVPYWTRYYGSPVQTYRIYMGYATSPKFRSSDYGSIFVNSNSYLQWGSYYTGYTAYNGPFSDSLPPTQNIRIGARDGEMYNLKYKSNISSGTIPEYADMGTASGYVVWFVGNRSDADSPTEGLTGVYGPPLSQYEIEWTAYFFSTPDNAIAGYTKKKSIQIDIHENKDWEYITLEPSVQTVAGYYDNGTQFNLGGVTANTTGFWENFSSPLDLSSFDSLSFFMKKQGIVPNEFKLRFHEGAYDSGASYTEFDLPSAGSDWTAVSIVNPSGNFSSNIQAISIHYTGSSDFGDAASISISNMFAVSSTGVQFSSLIGRNTPEAPHWYKIGALRYLNGETLITIANYGGAVENTPGGLGYYGSGINPPDITDPVNWTSDTVPTYLRTPLTIPNTITLGGNKGQWVIKGGWDRDTMTIQNSDTFIFLNSTTSDVVSLNTFEGSFISNIITMGGRDGWSITASNGVELYNCGATYAASCGINNVGNNSKFKMGSMVANNTAYFQQGANCFLSDAIIDGCNTAINYRGNQNQNHRTYNCVIRGGCSLDAIKMQRNYDCINYNMNVLGSLRNIFETYNIWNCGMVGGTLRLGAAKSSQAHMLTTNYESNFYFESVDAPSYFGVSQQYVYALGQSVRLTGPNGSRFYRYYQNGATSLERSPSIFSPTNTLPNGSPDPGNTVYKWRRSGTTVDHGWQSWRGGPQLSLGEVPVPSGATVTLTVQVLQAGLMYGFLALVCDSVRSTIGLEEDEVVLINNSASNTWQEYTLQVQANKEGVAVLHMYYYTDIINQTGSNNEVCFTDLSIS